MIRTSRLRGLSVVDVDAAEKIGEVEDVVLDLHARRVAGVWVSHGQPLLGGRQRLFLSASSARGLGPDALTVDRAQAPLADAAHLEALPRASDLVGRKVVSHGGELLGAVEDMLIGQEDGRIIGYALGHVGPSAGLDRLLGGGGARQPNYVRADADVRVGKTLIVVPDPALVRARDASGEPGLPMLDGLTHGTTVQWSDSHSLLDPAAGGGLR